MTAPPSRGPATVEVSDFKPLQAGSLVGFCDVHQPSGMTLLRCGIFQKDGRIWAAPPSKQIVGRDGAMRRSSDGKAQYEQTATFADRATRARWSDAVIAALKAAYPEALA